MTSNNDLNIILPFGILKAKSGMFEYSFQSRIKNIFGTMKVELILDSKNIVSKNEQFFITLIGE